MAASISFQATDSDNGTIGGSGGTYTFPLTVAAASGQERLVAVGGIGDFSNAADFTACTIDGQTGTRVGTVARGVDDGSNVAAFLTMYRAAGTSNTAINVVVTNGTFASIFGGQCALWTLNDADTVVATTNAAVNDPTLNTNTVTGGVAVAAVMGYNSTSGTTAWTGLTENFDSLIIFTTDLFTGASANIATGATPRSISADISPDLVGSIASICASFNPAAGGSTTFAAAAGSYAATGSTAADKFTLTAGQAGA